MAELGKVGTIVAVILAEVGIQRLLEFFGRQGVEADLLVRQGCAPCVKIFDRLRIHLRWDFPLPRRLQAIFMRYD